MKKAEDQEMPCPRCKKYHKAGPYVKQSRDKSGKVISAPKDVHCDCGAVLRYTVPLFCTDPFGWHWRIL